MTKKIKICFVFLLFFCLCTLVGCDTSEAITKSYEDGGYNVSVVKGHDTLVQGALRVLQLSEEQQKVVAGYDIIIATKGLDSAFILKAPKASDIKSLLTIQNEDGSKDTTAYENAKAENKINGNCLLLTATSNAAKLFK